MNKLCIWFTSNGVEDRELVTNGTRLSEILDDRGITEDLVKVYVNDVERSGSYELREGDRVCVSTKKYNSGVTAA